MRKITSLILVVCMAVTGTFMGVPQLFVPSEADMEVAAASYPALKTIKYKPTGDQRKDIIGFAKTQTGYEERGNNNTYFGSWFGCNYNPWCAMFVCWSAAKAGVPTSVIPRQANADRSWAKKQGVYYKSKYWGGSYTPKRGDLIYFSWSKRDWADHIGMVTGTGTNDEGVKCVFTIEGNKHDKVKTGSYPLNNCYVLGYASPKYNTKGSVEDTETAEQETTVADGQYILKYRDGLDSTSNDEEDAIIPPVTGTFGKDLTLSTTKFKRKGYSYSKWDVYKENSSGQLVYLCRDDATGAKEKWCKKSSISSGYSQVKVSPGDALNIAKKTDGPIYVSPVWKTATYKVTYDANGGTGAPKEQKKTYGKDLTLSKTKPTKKNTSFKGWATSADSTKVAYKGGETYTKNAKLELYAVWADGSTAAKDPKAYILRYTDGVEETTDDGDIIASQKSSGGKDLTLRTTTFTRTGYQYTEWSFYRRGDNEEKLFLCRSAETGEEQWCVAEGIPDGFEKVIAEPGSVLNVKEVPGGTLYAVPEWIADTYTIKYSANGGKSAPKQQTKTYDKELKLSKHKPTRTEYKFRGWAPSKDAKDPVYSAGASFKENKDMTLYAVWKKISYKAKTTDTIHKRKGPGKKYDSIGTIKKGKTIVIIQTKNGWGKLKGGGWVKLSYTKKVKSKNKNDATKATTKATTKVPKKSSDFTVQVTSADGVNARKGPGKKYDVATGYEKGQKLTIANVKKGWGQVRGTKTWVLLRYTKITNGYKVKITIDDLNQRKGPGVKYDSKGHIKPGTYNIVRINGEWGKVKQTGYWVYLDYTKRVK